jgi:hypothetical protein
MRGLMLSDRATPRLAIIAGAQKAGTTALWHYLADHPEIGCSDQKELHFFNYDSRFALGRVWYLAHFESAVLRGRKLGLEASPNHMTSPLATRRAVAMLGDVKFLCVVRDPAMRALSAWNHYRQRGLSSGDYAEEMRRNGRSPEDVRALRRLWGDDGAIKPFAECVREEIDDIARASGEIEPSIVRKGFYADQIAGIRREAGEGACLVVESIELNHDTRQTLSTVCVFLGVDPDHDWPAALINTKFHQRAKPAADRETIALLREYYRPYDERLAALCGRRLSWMEG